MKTKLPKNRPALYNRLRAGLFTSLKSIALLFLFSILIFSSKTSAQNPGNAHRWQAGDGWTYNLATGKWEATVYSANNDLPKGIVRCASSAETENGLQVYEGIYDGTPSIESGTNCFDPSNQSHDASVTGPQAGVTHIAW